MNWSIGTFQVLVIGLRAILAVGKLIFGQRGTGAAHDRVLPGAGVKAPSA